MKKLKAEIFADFYLPFSYMRLKRIIKATLRQGRIEVIRILNGTPTYSIITVLLIIFFFTKIKTVKQSGCQIYTLCRVLKK